MTPEGVWPALGEAVDPDLSTLLPRDKHDDDNANKIILLGFPSIEPIIPQILEWMQDDNWPVAQTLRPFVAGIGAPLAPYIRKILNSDDGVWKYVILHSVIARSTELRASLLEELERLALHPTPNDQLEEVDLAATEVLAGEG